MEKVLNAGKDKLDSEAIQLLEYESKEYIQYAQRIATTDPVTASFMAEMEMISLTEKFFDIRRTWTPAPKQRVSKINELHPALYLLIKQFYHSQSSLIEKLQILEKVVPLTFLKPKES